MKVNDAFDAWFWGFEVMNSRHVRDDVGWKYNNAHGCLLDINRAARCKFINLDIHDGGVAVGFWMGAVDCEIYGCTIHHYGYWNPEHRDKDDRQIDRGHGHAIYAQNKTGTKVMRDNMWFYGYGQGLQVYSSAGQHMRGMVIDGNIAFNAGRMCKRGGLLPEGRISNNYGLETHGPLDNITFTNNCSYHSRGGTSPNVYMGRGGLDYGTGVITNNYLVGTTPIVLLQWKKLTFTGNTVWTRISYHPALYIKYKEGQGFEDDEWHVDNNTYYEKPPGDRQFWINKQHMNFAKYRAATGFDAHTKPVPQMAPTENRVIIRPNRYEKGRANIAVYNWEHGDAAAVDLSKVLAVGQRYQVHNVMVDIWEKPVATGVYDGKPVSLPILKTKAAPDFPDFNAFLVKPLPRR